MPFCEKCLQSGLSFPEEGILPAHKLCSNCVHTLKSSSPRSQQAKSAARVVNLNTISPLSSGAGGGSDSTIINKQLEEMMEEQQFPLPVRERTRALDVGQKWQLIQVCWFSLFLFFFFIVWIQRVCFSLLLFIHSYIYCCFFQSLLSYFFFFTLSLFGSLDHPSSTLFVIQAYQQSLTAAKNEKTQPWYWAEKLHNPNSQIWKDPEKMIRCLNTVKSERKTWIVQFLRDKGLSALLTGIHTCKHDAVKTVALKVLNAIASTEPGLKAFVALPAAFSPLVLTTLGACSNDDLFEIFELLAFVASAEPDEGYTLITESMTSQQCSRTPLKPFVEMLLSKRVNAASKFKLLVLFNALVNTPDLLDDRQHVRQLLRSAGFPAACEHLIREANAARVAVDGSAPASVLTASPARPSRVMAQAPMATSSPSDSALPIHQAKRINAGHATIIQAPGVAKNRIIDQSEIWEMIRVQLELFTCAEEDDSIEATRDGVDFGNLDALLDYIRTRMSASVGQYLLPLLQMICALPLDGQRSQALWSAVLTVVKRVIGGTSDELLTVEQLFALTEQYAQQAGQDVNTTLLTERNNLETVVNDLRQRVRQLEQQLEQAPHNQTNVAVAPPADGSVAPAATSSNKELQHAKAELLGVRTELSQAKRALDEKDQEIAALKAGGAVAAAPAGGDDVQLQKALATIASLEQEIAALKAGGATAAAAAATTVLVNIPAPPCLEGFTPVPHQPTVAVAVAVGGGSPAAPVSNIPTPPCLEGFTPVAAPAGASAGAAGAAPGGKPGVPDAPVLPGFQGAAGGAGAGAGAAAAAGGSANQPDGKPWPPVLPGFTPQPGAPAGATAATAATTAAASSVAAAPAGPPPEEKPVLPYQRRAIKPTTKMRALHWTKLDNKAIKETVWFQLNDEKNVKLDTAELSTLFCQMVPKANAGPGADAAASAAAKAPAKQQAVTFIDGQRGQNMAIAISRFRPLTFEQLRDAVLQLDSKTLSLETASTMSKWLPTPEEVEAVSGYDGPVADLAQTDKYVLILGKVPAIDRRLEAFIFKLQYTDLHEQYSAKITLCVDLLQRIHASKAIQRLLEYVLALGNYLNGGTKKGDAYGFEIAFLTRLQDARSVDNKTNLLQYLLPILDKDPVTRDLQDVFQGIEDASRTDITQLTSDVGKFNGNVNKIKGLMNQCTQKPIPGDQFVTVMEPFVAKSEPVAQSLQKRVQDINKIALDIATMYGEDSKFGPSNIFSLYNDFNKQINNTRQELKRQAEAKEKAEKAAARAATGGLGGTAKKPGTPGGPGPAMTGLEGPSGLSQLQMALQQRKDRPTPPPAAPKDEEDIASAVNATLLGTDASSVLQAIKGRREQRGQQPGGGKRRSVFGSAPTTGPAP